MPFYRDSIYPHLVDFLGNPKPIREIRERIVPLADVFHEAGSYGKQALRGKRPAVQVDVAVSAPVMSGDAVMNGDQGEPPPRSEAERKLGELLLRQAQLAEDPSVDEQEYQSVIAEIARAQSEVTAGQEIGAQHARG